MTYITAERKHTVYSSEESCAQAFVRNTKEDLKDIAYGFFKVGFRLTEANKYRYYEELGYDNIIELAEDIFGIKKSTAYGLMQVYSYCRDRDKNSSAFDMDKAYVDYNFSQLQEISRLKWGGGEHLIKPSDSVAKIKQFVSAWNKDGERSDSRGCENITDYLRKTGRITEAGTEIFQISGKSEKEQEQSSFAPLLEMAEDTDDTDPGERSVQSIGLTAPAAPVPARSNEEIINECLRRDAFKNAIYKKYLEQPSKEEFIEYIKNLHAGHEGEWIYRPYNYRKYGKEDIVLTGVNCPVLIVHWSTAASRIRKLIESKQYLTEDELGLNPDKPASEIHEWESEGQSCEPDIEGDEDTEYYENVSARLQTPDDKLVEYCLTADCYAAALGIKLQIYDRYFRMEPTPVFLDFIINCYGNFSVPDVKGCGSHFKRLSSNEQRGLIIDRCVSGKLILNWDTVTGKIMNLIRAEKYLTAEEKEKKEKGNAKTVEAPHNEQRSNHERLQSLCVYDQAKNISEAVRSMPDDYGSGMPDRLTQWLSIWLMSESDLKMLDKTPHRQRTQREYLTELPDEEFVTDILLQVAKVYPLKCDSEALISTMRKRLIDWLNTPREI